MAEIIIGDLLEACERSYKAGNDAAIAVAQSECERRAIQSPKWLTAAINKVIEQSVQPEKKSSSGGGGGAHARILKRVNDARLHLYRMEVVLLAFDLAAAAGEIISNETAFQRAALMLKDHLAASRDPIRLIERSFKEARKLINDPAERDFLAPYVSGPKMRVFARKANRQK